MSYIRHIGSANLITKQVNPARVAQADMHAQKNLSNSLLGY